MISKVLLEIYTHFVDIARPLTPLMNKEVPFEWIKQCHDAFNLFKRSLNRINYVQVPCSKETITLFTDDSKYGLACVLASHMSMKLK